MINVFVYIESQEWVNGGAPLGSCVCGTWHFFNEATISIAGDINATKKINGASWNYKGIYLNFDKDPFYGKWGIFPSLEQKTAEIPLPEIYLITPDLTINSGSPAKIVASGKNVASYRWQESEDGVFWTDIVGATSHIYEPDTDIIKVSYYRCIALNPTGEARTQSIRVTVSAAGTYPEIEISGADVSSKLNLTQAFINDLPATVSLSGIAVSKSLTETRSIINDVPATANISGVAISENLTETRSVIQDVPATVNISGVTVSENLTETRSVIQDVTA
ncbi:MAG: hypothetical protein PHV39_02615 [Methanomicrobium sp.]|nr:hypothetical protein [Methanomicrobium sp.]